MPTYQEVLDSAEDNYRPNVVVDVDGIVYAREVPDSGLAVAAEKLLVDKVSFKPTKVDLRTANTTIDNAKAWLIDLDGELLKDVGANSTGFIGKTMKIYIGFLETPLGRTAMDFSDYLQTAEYKVKSFDKIPTLDMYKVEGAAPTDRVQVPTFDERGNLNSLLAAAATTVLVNTESDSFQASGFLKIENEFMSYSGKSFLTGVTTFTGVVRGLLDSNDVEHSAGAEVLEVTKVTENPIDLIAQLLISSGGGGAFDNKHSGAAIDQSLVDTAEFIAIRDNPSFPYSGDTMEFYLYDIPNLLKWMQEHLFVTNNVRLIKNAADNKISLAVLDQADLSADVFELDDDAIQLHPTYSKSERGMFNRQEVLFDWSEGLQQYKDKLTRNDTDSQSDHGILRGRTLRIKGAVSGFSGSAIATDRADRQIARFSTPQVKINVKAFNKAALLNVGDKIRLTTAQLPAEGGSLGMSSVVEVLSRAFNEKTGDVLIETGFTSYSNLRVGIISPSDALSSITSQKSFSVVDGTCWKVGYKGRLWDTLTQAYTADAVNTIATIVGNVVTMEDLFVTTLLVTHELHFPIYDDSNQAQRNKYAYVAPDSGTFTFDGEKSYQIVL